MVLDDYEQGVIWENKIKRLISNHLPYDFTLIKNDNPYEYDLELKKYDLEQKKNITIGYIEIERGICWKEQIQNYSFLQRKIHYWDKISKCFINSDIKDNFFETIYLRTNHDGTDMFCSDMFNITFLNKVYEYKEKYGERGSYYYRTDLEDTRVIRGIENCMNFIKKFFNNEIDRDEIRKRHSDNYENLTLDEFM